MFFLRWTPLDSSTGYNVVTVLCSFLCSMLLVMWMCHAMSCLLSTVPRGLRLGTSWRARTFIACAAVYGGVETWVSWALKKGWERAVKENRTWKRADEIEQPEKEKERTEDEEVKRGASRLTALSRGEQNEETLHKVFDEVLTIWASIGQQKKRIVGKQSLASTRRGSH